VIHECLQADIIREDGLRRRAAILALACVRSRRVELREQESRLRTTGVANDETGQWEAVLNKIPGISLWCIKQGGKVFVAFLFLVTRLAPFRHRLAVENEDVEESVQEEDGLSLDRRGIEQYRLTAFVVEAVTVKSGLDHDERVADVLVIQHVSVESGLIGRVIENLEEL